MTEKTIRDIMTTDLVAVGQDQSIGSVFGIMRRYKIRHLIITENDGTLVGIITDRDLRDAAPSKLMGKESTETEVLSRKVADIMIRYPKTASLDMSITEAAKLMLTQRIGCLPVVDQSFKPEGIVTTTDMLAGFIDFPREVGHRIQVEKKK